MTCTACKSGGLSSISTTFPTTSASINSSPRVVVPRSSSSNYNVDPLLASSANALPKVPSNAFSAPVLPPLDPCCRPNTAKFPPVDTRALFLKCCNVAAQAEIFRSQAPIFTAQHARNPEVVSFARIKAGLPLI